MRPAWWLLAFLLVSSCHTRPAPETSAPPDSWEWYFWTDDGARHYVHEIGEGPTVVVLHGGWGAEHSYLLDLVRPLADRFRFVLYDQRGSLRTPAPDETISLRRLVADLDKLRQALDQPVLTLLTHSMGSQLAYAYLREHPSRAGPLVLTSPVLPSDAPLEEEVIAAARRRFVDFARASEERQVEEEGLSGRPWSDLSDRERSARNQISLAAGNLFRVDRWRQLRGGQAFYNERVFPLLLENSPESAWEGLFDALRTHPHSVTVVIGDHDLTDFGVAAWPLLVERPAAAELVVIERSGHNGWIDRPRAYREAVAAALEAATANTAAPES